MVGTVSAAALVLSGLVLASPAHAEGEVPILGQVMASSSDATSESTMDVLVSVHGVRRVDGATLVYYSAGFTPDSAQGAGRRNLIHAFGFESALSPLHADAERMGDVAVLDGAGRKAYTTMYTGDYTDRSSSDCLCLRWVDALPSEPGSGTAYAAVAALPTIPEGLDSVTLRVLGHHFRDVAVEDGPMEPAAQDAPPVVLGMGWPTIDPALLEDVPDPSRFVLPLTTHEVIEDSALSERSGEGSRSLDLSADVLFDFDEATPTGRAKKEIRAAAEKIKDADVEGTLTVTGHTDSDGAADYNQDLSERRAESVAKTLKPLLPSGVTITTDGKGESDPIASNKTDDGKSLNRRVTITLPEDQ